MERRGEKSQAISRREFLIIGGATAAATLLARCAPNTPVPSSNRVEIPLPMPEPNPNPKLLFTPPAENLKLHIAGGIDFGDGHVWPEKGSSFNAYLSKTDTGREVFDSLSPVFANDEKFVDQTQQYGFGKLYISDHEKDLFAEIPVVFKYNSSSSEVTTYLLKRFEGEDKNGDGNYYAGGLVNGIWVYSGITFHTISGDIKITEADGKVSKLTDTPDYGNNAPAKSIRSKEIIDYYLAVDVIPEVKKTVSTQEADSFVERLKLEYVGDIQEVANGNIKEIAVQVPADRYQPDKRPAIEFGKLVIGESGWIFRLNKLTREVYQSEWVSAEVEFSLDTVRLEGSRYFAESNNQKFVLNTKTPSRELPNGEKTIVKDNVWREIFASGYKITIGPSITDASEYEIAKSFEQLIATQDINEIFYFDQVGVDTVSLNRNTDGGYDIHVSKENGFVVLRNELGQILIPSIDSAGNIAGFNVAPNIIYNGVEISPVVTGATVDPKIDNLFLYGQTLSGELKPYYVANYGGLFETHSSFKGKTVLATPYTCQLYRDLNLIPKFRSVRSIIDYSPETYAKAKSLEEGNGWSDYINKNLMNKVKEVSSSDYEKIRIGFNTVLNSPGVPIGTKAIAIWWCEELGNGEITKATPGVSASTATAGFIKLSSGWLAQPSNKLGSNLIHEMTHGMDDWYQYNLDHPWTDLETRNAEAACEINEFLALSGTNGGGITLKSLS